MSPDANLDHTYPAFRKLAFGLQFSLNAWCSVHAPGYKPIITETFRSSARQKELYAQGRTTHGDIVTQKNGTTNLSNHQRALAADFALKGSDGELVWSGPIARAYFQYLGHCARAVGLKWGGDWKSPVDCPHVEWDATDRETYAKAAEWKAANGLR